MAEEDKIQSLKASILARTCLVFLLFFSFLFGCFVAGVALHDPDTCWLLALGNQIFNSHAVPFKDSFSYTFEYLAKNGSIDYAGLTSQAASNNGGRVFVAYQWLTEVLFYLSYMVAAGYGLVVTCCVTLISALIVVPLLVFQKLKSSMLVGILIVVFGVVASCFHFLARPEVFSYLFFALVLLILAHYRYQKETTEKASKCIFLIPIILLPWVNMHTGFAYAFITLVFFSVTQTIEALLTKQRLGVYEGFAWLALFVSFLVSLINPHGFGLWVYLPELFFSPLNKHIVELQPISAKDLTEWTYYPFFIVSASVLAVFVRNMISWIKRRHLPRSWMFTTLAVFTAIGGGIFSRRVIPFDTVFLVCEAAWLLRHTGVPFWEAGEEHDEHDTLLHMVDHRLMEIMKDGSWAVLSILLSLFGVYLISARVSPPTIPQKSSAFAAPQKLMSFIASQDDLGRLFNDPQIGDMIIWHLQTDAKSALAEDPWRVENVKYRPKVFIDTRFDMYGEPLVSDYYKIANCQSGWKVLFDKYKFDWVVLRRKQNLHKQLEVMPGWKQLYKDTSAVIYVREREAGAGGDQSKK